MSDFSDFMIFPSWHQPLTRIGNDHVVSVSPFSEIKHLLSTSIWIHEVIKNDYGYCSETHGRIERERENIFFFLFNIITAASNNIPVGWQGKKRASLTQLARNLMITNFHPGQLFISPFHLTDILCTGIVPVSQSVCQTHVSTEKQRFEFPASPPMHGPTSVIAYDLVSSESSGQSLAAACVCIKMNKWRKTFLFTSKNERILRCQGNKKPFILENSLNNTDVLSKRCRITQ